MDDLISRQAAIDALAEHEKSNGHNYTLFVDIVSECAEIIRDLPSVQPERAIGKWMDTDNYYQRWKCSVCGCHTRDAKPPYCSHCGARMESK